VPGALPEELLQAHSAAATAIAATQTTTARACFRTRTRPLLICFDTGFSSDMAGL